jgi:hypothetical protein
VRRPLRPGRRAPLGGQPDDVTAARATNGASRRRGGRGRARPPWRSTRRDRRATVPPCARRQSRRVRETVFDGRLEGRARPGPARPPVERRCTVKVRDAPPNRRASPGAVQARFRRGGPSPPARSRQAFRTRPVAVRQPVRNWRDDAPADLESLDASARQELPGESAPHRLRYESGQDLSGEHGRRGFDPLAEPIAVDHPEIPRWGRWVNALGARCRSVATSREA